MSDVKALIAEGRKAQSVAFAENEVGYALIIRALTDALEAATVASVVDREALVRVLDPSGAEGRHIGRSHAGVVLHERQAAAIADAILSSGIIRSEADVKAEALEEAADDTDEHYPEGVFPQPNAHQYDVLAKALAKANLSLDRFSADLMRRAAEQDRARAAQIREARND